jgi:hypothetical protein
LRPEIDIHPVFIDLEPVSSVQHPLEGMSASLQFLSSSGAQGSFDARQSPLSYAQETMLYWDRLVPRSPAYNVPPSPSM